MREQQDLPEVFDLSELTSRCLGRIDFVERVLAKFLQHFDRDFKRLEEAIASENAAEVRQVAHRLKGASANVAAIQLRARAADIEEMAELRQIEAIRSSLDQMREEWSRFRKVAAPTMSGQ